MANGPFDVGKVGHFLTRFHFHIENPAYFNKARNHALVCAFMLRLAWALAIPVIPISDSSAYDVFAQNIALGNGYCFVPGQLTAYWAVGTPAVYGFFYSIFGHHYVPIVIVNIGLGVGTVALAMALARRWLGEATAVMTGWFLAFWPVLIQFTTILASEILFNFCVLAAFWLASAPGWKCLPRAFATGLALAAASYVRPVALLIAPLAYLREAVFEGRWLRAMTACAVSCVIMLALILPWSMRNQDVFGRFALISTNAGSNFWMGNNPQSTGGYMPLPETGIANEVDRDHYLNRQAWEYVRQYPLAFVARTLKKAVLLHDRESIGIAWNEKGLEQRFGSWIVFPLKLVSSPYWWVMLAGGLYGGLMLLRQRSWLDALTLPPLTAWAYFVAVHSVVVNGDRYHMPSIPFVAMLAAYGLNHWLAARRRHGATLNPKGQ